MNPRHQGPRLFSQLFPFGAIRSQPIRLLGLAALVCFVSVLETQAQPGGGRGSRGGRSGFGGGGFGGGGFGGGGFGGFGGGGFGGGISGLLRDPAVKTEIGLTEEQEEEIRAAQENVGGFDREAMQARFQAIQDAKTDEERTKLQEEMRSDGEKRQKAQDAAIKSVLKPEQIARLDQISLQRNGLSALKDDEVASSLKITDQQKKKYEEIQAEFEKQMADMRALGREGFSFEKMEQARTDRDAALDQLLTADQRKVWETKLGPPAPKSERFGGPPGGQRRERTGSGGGLSRGPIREEKVPDGALAVVDFSSDATDAQNSDLTKAAPADATGNSVPGAEKLMSFKFRFAPWEIVLKHFAEHAGLTLDLNVVPPGTFNYYDNGKYTVTQALDIINGYLLQKGYVLVRRDKFLVVVNIDNGIDPNLVPDVAVADLPKRGRNELVRVLLPIEGIAADVAADEAQELLGPQGKIVPLSKSNRLVVTDIASNIIRIHELLNGLSVIPADAPMFQSFPVKHVSVLEAEKVVRDLFGLPQRGVVTTPVANQSSSSRGGFPVDFSRGFSRGSFGRGDFGRGDFGRGDFGRGGDSPQTQTSTSSSNVASNSRISVATDLRTNTLMVTAKPDDLKIVESAITTLDVDEETNNQSRNLSGKNSPQFEVYAVTTADPAVMIQTINNLVPAAIVTEDSKARRLHVFATSDEQIQIKGLIQQIDGGVEGGETALVVNLRRLDPLGAAGSLRNLFKGTDRNAQEPSIEADPIGRRLMIRGTTAQMTEIRQLLKQMGEDPDGTGLPDPGARGSVRTLSLGGRDPQEFAELIQKLWPSRDANPIRIVVPSSLNRTLKTGAHHTPGESDLDESELGRPTPSTSSIKTKTTSPIKIRQSTPTERVGSPSESEAGALLNQFKSLLDAEIVDNELEAATADDSISDIADEDSEEESGADVEADPIVNDPAATGEIQPEKQAEGNHSPERPDSKQTGPEQTGDVSETPAPTQKTKSTTSPGAGSDDEKKASAIDAGETALPARTKAAPQQPDSERERPVYDEPAEPQSRARFQKSPPADVDPSSPITLVPSGSNLVLTSEDTEALDRLQSMIEAIAQASPKRQTWTVFYLSTADATETATMLGHLFPSGSISQSADTSSMTMMGSLTGGISSFGSSLMDMTGLSSLGAATSLRIVPEIRSNALYVSGPVDLVEQVEDVLKVLDASELPESLRDRMPRMIAVEYADVDEVAEIIENVYKDYMQAPAALPGGGGGGGGINPLAMLMAASGGGGDKQKGRGIRLTIGVDSRTSSVVVSSDEALYRQIKAMVETLDQAALEANRTIRVIQVDAAKSVLVQQALGSLVGKVKVSSTGSGRSGPGSSPFEGPPPFGGQNENGGGRTGRSSRGGGGSGSSQEDELRQRFLQGAGLVPPGGGANGGNSGRGGRSGFGGGTPGGGGGSGRRRGQ